MAMNCMILSSKCKSSRPLNRYVCFLPSLPIIEIFLGLVLVGSTDTSNWKDSRVTGWGGVGWLQRRNFVKGDKCLISFV